ncbi:Keratin-associated protein 5-5, partial [Ophiophagus hannah]
MSYQCKQPCSCPTVCVKSAPAQTPCSPPSSCICVSEPVKVVKCPTSCQKSCTDTKAPAASCTSPCSSPCPVVCVSSCESKPACSCQTATCVVTTQSCDCTKPCQDTKSCAPAPEPCQTQTCTCIPVQLSQCCCGRIVLVPSCGKLASISNLVLGYYLALQHHLVVHPPNRQSLRHEIGYRKKPGVHHFAHEQEVVGFISVSMLSFSLTHTQTHKYRIQLTQCNQATQDRKHPMSSLESFQFFEFSLGWDDSKSRSRLLSSLPLLPSIPSPLPPFSNHA